MSLKLSYGFNLLLRNKLNARTQSIDKFKAFTFYSWILLFEIACSL